MTGGCARGYHSAGFDVVGVDHKPQKRYPFPFIQADALYVLERFLLGGIGTVFDKDGRNWGLEDFDVIHASPPCQRFSSAARRNGHSSNHPDLLTPTRQLLLDLAFPLWVIENVTGAPMRPPAIQLCGLMFGLQVFRHRWFESPLMLLAPFHDPHASRRIGTNGFCCVSGNGDYTPGNWRSSERKYAHKAAWAKAMQIDWMTRDELSQAIPPAYCHFIGNQLMNVIS